MDMLRVTLIQWFIWSIVFLTVVTTQDVCRNPENTNTIIYVCKDNTIETANDVYFDTSKAPTFTEIPRECDCSISVKHYSRAVVGTTANVSFVEPSQLGTLSFQIFDDASSHTFNSSDDRGQVVLQLQTPLVITYRSTASHRTYKACLHLIANHNETLMDVTCTADGVDTTSSSKPSMSTPASDTTTFNDAKKIVDNDNKNSQEVPIVPIIAGVCGGVVAVVIIVVIVIVLRRKRRREDTGNDSDSEVVDNQMYNMVDIKPGDDTRRVNVAHNYSETIDTLNGKQRYTTTNRAGLSSDTEEHYAEPDDSVKQQTFKNNTNDGKYSTEPSREYDYTIPSLSNQQNIRQAVPNTFKKPKTNIEEHVYDHTMDKQKAMPVNEYSHLGNAMEHYDSTENISKPKNVLNQPDNEYDTTS